MDPKPFVQMLEDTKERFERSTRCLVEGDSTFAPYDGVMTAAQQVAHVARTVDGDAAAFVALPLPRVALRFLVSSTLVPYLSETRGVVPKTCGPSGGRARC